MAVCKRNGTNLNDAIKLAATFVVAAMFIACGGDSGRAADGEESSAPTEDSAEELGQKYIREYVHIQGVAKTGMLPFKENSAVNMHELKNDLTPSGRVHYSTTSDEGNYDFCDVNLVYPYAKLEVRGLYWNEVKGAWSKDSLTLRTLSGFMDEQSKEYENGYYKRNIDLLDHLMYDRGIYLLQEKGYGSNIAWWQAAQEIMFAFGFLDEATMGYIDEVKRMDIDTGMVEDKGKYVEIRDAESFRSLLLTEAIFRYNDDAYLQAIWMLFLGDRSDTEIQKTIDKFIADIRTDGVWDDQQTKADMADWAYELDYSKIQKNLKNRGVTLERGEDSYEEILEDFWENAYGLGDCGLDDNRVAQNTNKFSKHYKKYFACKTVDFQSGWVESEREKVIGPCEKKNAGVISKYDGGYYICRNNFWEYATAQEYDTYGWTAGSEGEVRKGSVDSTNYYVYRNDEWQKADGIEIVFGGCTWNREGVVVKADSSFYTDYNDDGQMENKWRYYYSICKLRNWVEATELEYDTYGFGSGSDGEVRAGKVNKDKYYVYENGSWRVSDGYLENSLGVCVASREGEVTKHTIPGSQLESGKDRVDYYICKEKEWKTSTQLLYDTQGWSAGTAGEMRTAIDDTSHHYIYRNGEWQYAGRAEVEFGACVASREGEINSYNGGYYYICKSSGFWEEASAFEYDTYGWGAGNDGEFRKGNVTDVIYVYNGSNWAVSERETTIGLCGTTNAGVVSKFGSIYYICKNNAWDEATVLEYDTYGMTCLTDGSIVSGEVSPYYPYYRNYKYVCDAGAFRTANAQEISLNKGCVSYTEGLEIRKHVSEAIDSVYLCSDGLWNITIETFEGYLFDSRDGKIYKTVTIGTQTWMAENLNYAYTGVPFKTDDYTSDSTSWCYNNRADNCAKYGRLYTWSAAMDSAATWSDNGKDCGYGVHCSPTFPVQGICPNGWHLPSKNEWETLRSAAGKNSGYALRSEYGSGWNIGWNEAIGGTCGYGDDTFGFRALPAGSTLFGSSYGNFSGYGDYTYFWSSKENDFSNVGIAYSADLERCEDGMVMTYNRSKRLGCSVRCLKDQ